MEDERAATQSSNSEWPEIAADSPHVRIIKVGFQDKI